MLKALCTRQITQTFEVCRCDLTCSTEYVTADLKCDVLLSFADHQVEFRYRRFVFVLLHDGPHRILHGPQ